MALTACPECSGSISEPATACPHCGHPIAQAPTGPPASARSAKRALMWLGLLILAAPFALMLGAYGTLSPCDAMASAMIRRVPRFATNNTSGHIRAAFTPFIVGYIQESMTTVECLHMLPYVSAGRFDTEIRRLVGDR